MNFITYCEEPRFFIKIYNNLTKEKQFEFEKKFNEFRNLFNEYHDNKLFHPQISFKDGYIIIKQDKYVPTRIDVREELDDKLLVSEDLLERILHEFNVTHGLYVQDLPLSNTDNIKYKIDNNDICDEIEKILD